ncbi:hypothetical protein [Amycolatopsis thermoflava]|uniref:hypothetical protein n=1 Tax=Amycolatopsis thermoflava TaxID=84480 RepID=UPI00382ED101
MRPLVVYLDQNIWVKLLRAKVGGEHQEVGDLLGAMQQAVRDGIAIFPLSGAHYMETWHRRKETSRLALAELMKSLSGFATIAPAQLAFRKESEQILNAILRGAHPDQVSSYDGSDWVIGHGVDHAFDSPTGRLRIVESVATKEAPEGRELQPPRELLELIGELKRRFPAGYEWWSLSGEGIEFPDDGFELHTQHRRGDEYVDEQNRLAASIADARASGMEPRDVVVAQYGYWLYNSLLDLAASKGVDLRLVAGWLVENYPSLTGVRLLIDQAAPTSSVALALTWEKHRNPQWGWNQHDLADITSLSVAGAYADVVVTERQWAHALVASGAAKRWNTRATAKLSELSQILDSHDLSQ